jgi:two-component system nitrogen regulation sensor histidine kinase GlnL
MPGGGRLTLTTRLALDTVFGGRVDVGAGPRPLVVVQVTDDGEGIAAGLLDRVFDPFVTTKTRGLGLGLALAHRIVEEHRGALRVTSTPGKGTTFSCFLPIAPTTGVPPPSGLPSSDSPRPEPPAAASAR